MANDNLTIENRAFNQSNTFNVNTEDGKTDGLSVLCFSENLHIEVNNCTIDGEQARWGAKMSKNFYVTYNNCTFKNGTARSFDMVRGGVVTFNNCKFLNEGTRKKVTSAYLSFGEGCDIGIKCGVRDVIFNECELNDILIGDYSIYDQQDRPKARRFTFNNCKNPNGGAIIIRGRHFDKNTLEVKNTKVSVFTWPEIVMNVYWWYNRKFGDTRKPDGWNVIDDRETV